MRLWRIKLQKLIEYGRQRNKIEIKMRIKKKMTKLKESKLFNLKKEEIIEKMNNIKKSMYRRRRPKVTRINVKGKFFLIFIFNYGMNCSTFILFSGIRENLND